MQNESQDNVIRVDFRKDPERPLFGHSRVECDDVFDAQHKQNKALRGMADALSDDL